MERDIERVGSGEERERERERETLINFSLFSLTHTLHPYNTVLPIP